MKLVWFPTWKCNNYADESRCPYCPYGWDNETDSLKYQGKISCKEQSIDHKIIKAFFLKNKEAMGNTIEITGGEPLMYPHLSEVLDIPMRWAITSNTSIPNAVGKLIESGVMEKCFSWTASYHPFSRRDKEFSSNLALISLFRIPIHITTVVSKDSLKELSRVKDFLSLMPAYTKTYHLDAHNGIDGDLKEEAEKIIGHVTWAAGEPRYNMTCKKRSDLLALSPGGELFECVTHCYTGKDSLGIINPDYDINNLEKKLELCTDECFACCDRIKHIIL